jgi:hypothetical protein
VLTTVGVRAQTCIYNGWTDPTYTPTGTTYIVGVGNSRSQIRIPAVFWQNVPHRITELWFAQRGGWRRHHFDQLIVRMGHTTAGPLVANFNSNITSPLQTVLPVDDHDWLFGPGPAWIPIALQEPFQFLPGHGDILVEIRALGITASNHGRMLIGQ